MKQNYAKRFFTAALSAVMAVTLFPAQPLKAAETADLEPYLLAEFDFNEEASGGKFLSGDITADVIGTVKLEERDAVNQKALYLDGSASYLELKKTDGSSLLTGLEELTVSFDAKPGRTDTNWVFYAAPNTESQTFNKEHYIGALLNGGTTTIERYHNTNSRPGSASASTGTDWSHVDVVFEKNSTTIYVDGKAESTEASSYALPDILGGSSIFQIGKANWGSGEYSKVWIDNFKVYSKALTTEEIFAVPDPAYIQTLLEKQAEKIAPVTIQSEKMALPDYDKTVTWRSEMPQITIAENGLTATTVQPENGEASVTGKLIAVLSMYGTTREIEIAVTIEPQIGADEEYGYLMVHFIEDSVGYAEKIYLDISRGDNPEQWDPLNEGQPILTSNLGTTGVRDPFITCNPDTGTYYIIGTDLRVFGADNAGWGAWQNNYSTKMNVWESEDLITWSEVRQFDVALNTAGEKQANMGMMWAPEATWVPDYYGENDGAFVVYWSSQCYKDEAQTQTDSGSRIMWGATKDFTQETWEFGGVFLDGGASGYIDTTIIQNNGKTYHITKSHAEQIIMESTTDKEWWKQGANWTRIQSNIGESRFGSVEGPAVFKDHTKENSWYLFVDDLPVPGYQPMYSTDLDRGWDYLDSENYFLTQFTKHGGVISLKKGQYDAIRDADAISLAEQEKSSVTVSVGAEKEDILAALPQTASVNLAYELGVSELPVNWDISSVDTAEEGVFTVSGVVASIGANKNQWVGEQNSTHYLAENKQLYSSRELKVNADITVTAEVETPVEAASVSLDKNSLTLKIGETAVLKASIEPSEAVNTELIWESSAPNVAEVKDGAVTAKAEGTAKITVKTANDKRASCTVTVQRQGDSSETDQGKDPGTNPAPGTDPDKDSGTNIPPEVSVTSVKLNQNKLTLGVKEKYTLQTSVLPQNASVHNYKFTSSKTGVATVSKKGVVTAKKAGKATITVTAGGKTAKCQVTVKAAPKKITLNAKSKSLKKNKTFQIKVKLPDNTASNKITYKSSNKNIASVSSSGKVKAIKKGNATITVKSFNGKKATLKIRVI